MKLNKKYFQILRFCFLPLLFLLASAETSQAQVVLTLDYKLKAGEPSTIESGKLWTMQLDYAVSSTTGSASGVKVVIPMPDYVHDVTNFVGTAHAPIGNFVWDGTVGAKKLTITFVNPVASGSTGVLEFQMRTKNGATPNNTLINTCATLTDDSGASAQACHTETITAQPSLCGFKTLKSGGAIDAPTTYKILVGYGSSAGNYYTMPFGTLNSTNVSLTDTYPAGAEFVSAKVYTSYNAEIPTTVTQGANSVTVTIPDYIANQVNVNGTTWEVNPSYYVEVTVKYNSGAGFGNGQSVTNNASLTFTPSGGSSMTVTDGMTSGACTSDLTETHTLSTATISATIVKNHPSTTTLHPDELMYYFGGFTNTSNVGLDNVELIETVPTGLIVANGPLYAAAVFFSNPSVIAGADYQTNLNASWTNWALSGDRLYAPTLGAGEVITKYRIRLISPFPANATTGEFLLEFKGGQTASTINLNNCLEWNSSTANLPASRIACDNTVNLEPASTNAKVYYTASHTPGCANPYAANQTITLDGNVKAETGYSGLTNPVCFFYLEPGFIYQAGSETFEVMTSGLSAPTLTVTPNYGGGTKTLYRWAFPNGTVLPAGTEFKVHVNVQLGASLPTGITVSQDMNFIATGSNVGVYNPSYNYGTVTDTYDYDGDGNTSETFPRTATHHNSCDLLIAGSASMESVKWVKGLCDTQYSKYPNYGQTVPGGNADYKLIVTNTGNVTMKDIKIIDILPFIGDRGVIDTSPRSTQWTPNLADPIVAPAGITVYYSTSGNPCRDEMKGAGDPSPFPTGCESPNWSITPPANITAVKSVKIDFGATTLAGGQSLEFSWPMRAPINAPTNNEIAWNSFGFVATRTDNNQPLLAAEPNKVGIKVKGSSPAYYGNRVWFDTNHDGIQDAGEGGVDGVKVKLFKVPSLGSVPNPATDQLINFTITGNGGFYRFANLQPGFYYTVFCLPNGYAISPKNTGSIANDSDGSPTSYQGLTATITAVTELSSTEDDDTWDQGIYCGFSPTVTTNSPVPVGGTLTMSVTPASGSYAWAGPNGWTATGSSVSRTNMTGAEAGGYGVNVYQNPDGTGCWASINVEVVVGSVSCTPPNVTTPIATQATCNAAGTAANNDASISISTVSSATSYAYTSDGSTPTYASAIALSGSSISLTNLPNPASATTYKFRVFNGAETCYTDVSVVLNPKVCSPSCSMPNVAPAVATQATCNAAGTAANNDASVTISAVNTATSYAYTSDGTAPSFASAVALSGSSITISNLPNPASATTYTIRVFNGSATCYTDVSTILNPKVCSPSCSMPNVAPAVATQATCNVAGTAANNDASVTISAVNTATSYAYTSDGTAPSFASAVALSGSSITISNLPNPASATTYMIRVFNGSATCYTDVSTVLNPKVCSPSCSMPNVAPAVATQATCNAAGTAANNDASVTISAVNTATSYAYTSDGTDPAFASAVAISGSAITISNLPNPASATTYKIRVFNGSATCYTDVSTVLNPKVCSPSCTLPNVAPAVATQATCNAAGTAANNDASISISAVNTATSYAYTSDGTDPAFASAVAISGSSITISNLPNPASATTYKIRVFNGSATCYTDVSTVLNPKVCSPSCTTPDAGANQTICLPKTTLNLTDAPAGYQWVAAPGNSPVATINATSGEITGMTAVGTYAFRLQKTTDATCYDEMQVAVTNGEAVIILCNDGSTSYTLIAQPGVTNVKWYNMNGQQVGTGNSIIISSATTGLEDGTEAFYYTATVVADGCDAELCCPVKFATQNCCPVPNCLSITVIKK